MPQKVEQACGVTERQGDGRKPDRLNAVVGVCVTISHVNGHPEFSVTLDDSNRPLRPGAAAGHNSGGADAVSSEPTASVCQLEHERQLCQSLFE